MMATGNGEQKSKDSCSLFVGPFVMCIVDSELLNITCFLCAGQLSLSNLDCSANIMTVWAGETTNEKTTLVVEGECACKLFDFFCTYKKLVCTPQLSENDASTEAIMVGLMPTQEVQEEVKAKVSQ